MDLAPFEVDIGPGQAAQLRGAQTREDGGQEERTPAGVLVELGDDGADLARGRDVDAGLELAASVGVLAAAERALILHSV